MKIKQKLRKLGNSWGIIIPPESRNGYNIGDIIEVEVITSEVETPKKDKGTISGMMNAVVD